MNTRRRYMKILLRLTNVDLKIALLSKYQRIVWKVKSIDRKVKWKVNKLYNRFLYSKTIYPIWRWTRLSNMRRVILGLLYIVSLSILAAYSVKAYVAWLWSVPRPSRRGLFCLVAALLAFCEKGKDWVKPLKRDFEQRKIAFTCSSRVDWVPQVVLATIQYPRNLLRIHFLLFSKTQLYRPGKSNEAPKPINKKANSLIALCFYLEK